MVGLWEGAKVVGDEVSYVITIVGSGVSTTREDGLVLGVTMAGRYGETQKSVPAGPP